MTSLLNVRDLSVTIPTRFGDFKAIESINLSIERGQIHGLVGESGAGKSTIGSAIIGLLESPAYVSSGTITFSDQELTTLSQSAYHRLRGDRISMIFQDPQTSLNPLLSISDQLVETIRQHRELDYPVARDQAIALLIETGIQDAATRIDDFPHQFSGGMRQRVVIALALCTDPDLIIADEPTTALDVSNQKQILKLIRELASDRGAGVLLITHDIGVIAQVCDVVTVLRHGKLIEHGQSSAVLGSPDATYTRQLMAAVPRLNERIERFVNIVTDDTPDNTLTPWQISGASADFALQWLLGNTSRNEERDGQTQPVTRSDLTVTTTPSILQVDDLSVTFGMKHGWFRKAAGFAALQNISFHMQAGSVLGIVGESGSGKSTLAKAIAGLVPISSGTMQFNGVRLPDASSRSRRHPSRQQIQMVFQDPYSSLNNRRTVESILSESLRFYQLASKSDAIRKLVASMLDLVEMPQRAMLKYPHQFSGGQRQRIAIARALIARPDFLICDEPTSALDVSIQAQVLNLIKELQLKLGLSVLFITHDLAVIRHMADDIVVFRKGNIVEFAKNSEFFNSPVAEYSRQLLQESPSLEVLGTSQ